MNQSVTRALQILNLFTKGKARWRLNEIAKEMGMAKATVFRLLASLEAEGFLTKTKQSDQDVGYELGLKLLELGTLVQEQMSLRKVALPHMKRLNRIIDEIVLLVVSDGDHAVYIEKVESRNPLRLYARVGRISPLYLGSGPKLLLAMKPDEEREEILQRLVFQPRTENTFTDREALNKELNAIRRRGYAMSFGEQDRGITGLSFPVFDHQGRVAAALTSSIPTERFQKKDRTELLESLRQAAVNISRDLGYREKS